MKEYLDLLNECYVHGKQKENRTGTGTKYLFGTHIRIDLQKGFPLLTTKKVQFRAVVAEMIGFFKGVTTVEGFRALGCPVWDEWGLSRSVFAIVTREQQDMADELAEKLKVTPPEGLAMLQEAAQASIDYHQKMSELCETETQESMNEWMIANPQPPSYENFLISHGISPRKQRHFGHEGDLGPIYGKQWIKWSTPDGREINQLKQIVHQLKTNPMDRRIILTGWNPADISDGKSTTMVDGVEINSSKDRCDANVLEGKMALPPCHLMTIFDVDTSGDRPRLNAQLTMRSNDLPLGCPFNIAGYALFVYILAKMCDMEPGTLVIATANSHIYMNQIEGVEEQLTRRPTELPTLEIPDGIDITDADSLTIETVDAIVAGLKNYNPQAFIKFPISV